MKDYANRIQISDNHQQNRTMNDEDIGKKERDGNETKSWLQSDNEGVNFKSKLELIDANGDCVCAHLLAAFNFLFFVIYSPPSS